MIPGSVVWSPSTGLLARIGEGGPPNVRALGVTAWSNGESWHPLSHVDDWYILQQAVAESEQSIKGLIHEHRCDRAVALGLSLLEDLSAKLREAINIEMEELFQLGVPSASVVNQLLVAPLCEERRARAAHEAALEHGHIVTAAALAEVIELQPLLRRFVAHWLALPGEFFATQALRQEAWSSLVIRATLRNLIEAESKDAFRFSWNLGLLAEGAPEARIRLGVVGEALARRIFPEAPVHTSANVDILSEKTPAAFVHSLPVREGGSFDRLERALKQVGAIEEALANGRDDKAAKYLRQLITNQLESSESEFAVKSLCNVAQRCAEMFRPDFERACLEGALSLAPSDPWTLIQWGDHLKRVGAFGEAAEALALAAGLAVGEQATVAQSNLADVYTEQEDYKRAEAIYKSIPDWQNRVIVRTALADILRHQGEWELARNAYKEVLAAWPDQVRCWTGMAEVEKEDGNLKEASALYARVLEDPTLDERSRTVYSLAKCGVLRRGGQLTQALKIADSVVASAPFLMQARIERGAILALLGRADEGVAGIAPGSLPPSAATWMYAYVTGLTLLWLRRVDDASVYLVDQLLSLPLGRSGGKLGHLAAALVHLVRSDKPQAQDLLDSVGAMSDRFAASIKLVLDLHLAQSRNDTIKVERLVRQLKDDVSSEAPIFSYAISAIRDQRFDEAVRLEAQLLLSAA